MNEISGGSSQITGHFDIKEAQDLANILKSGKLPAPARIIADEIVGPSLGSESIQSGMWSFVIAFALVLVYMLFFYSRGAGLAADIALFTNLFFLFGVLASIGAVLTLPGIAGIVLTMGMSVDANVLIYERIQEELRSGKGMRLAIKEGYKQAYSAIIDGNVTTLLTGFILYYFGEGPIKGFATTLIIGIFTSLFSAIFITRIILDYASQKNDNVKFTTPFTANWLRDVHFPFLERRKVGYTVSGIITIICIASLFTKGLDKGIDFVGGRTYTVSFDQPVQVEDIAASLANGYTENRTYYKMEATFATSSWRKLFIGSYQNVYVETFTAAPFEKSTNYEQVNHLQYYFSGDYPNVYYIRPNDMLIGKYEEQGDIHRGEDATYKSGTKGINLKVLLLKYKFFNKECLVIGKL